MANRHKLKTWPEPFQGVWSGSKTFEIRPNDRGFEVGDVLILQEWTPDSADYTGREITANVVYMVKGGDWGLPAGLCVMGLRVRDRRTGAATIHLLTQDDQPYGSVRRCCERCGVPRHHKHAPGTVFTNDRDTYQSAMNGRMPGYAACGAKGDDK